MYIRLQITEYKFLNQTGVYMYLLGCQFQLVPTIYHNFTTHWLVKVWPIKIETILTCPCFAGLLLAPLWWVEQALCVVYDQRTENSRWKKFLPFAEKCTMVCDIRWCSDKGGNSAFVCQCHLYMFCCAACIIYTLYVNSHIVMQSRCRPLSSGKISHISYWWKLLLPLAR